MRPDPHALLAVMALFASAVPGALSGCGGADDSGSTFDASARDATDAASLRDDAGVVGFDDGSPSFGQDAPSVYDDFPVPVLANPDGGAPTVPSSAPQLFGPGSQGAPTGGPCLVEPEVGSLYPRNWLRPRFRWNAPSGQNLFELRLHAANQQDDLVVYTGATSWTMPTTLWDNLRLHSSDVAMTVSVRGGVLSGAQLTGEALGTSGSIGVAPADAPGTIVYWTTSNGTALKGFRVGDETVGATLVTSQVQQVAPGCLGCHNGTPDGEYAVFATDVNSWGNAIALIDPGDAGTAVVGSAPPFLGAGARQTLATGRLGISSLSKAHWSSGDRVMVASDGKDLVWVDFEAANAGTARGNIARNGTQTGGGLAGAPSWSHDGKTVAYVATDHLSDGRLGGYALSPSDPGARADLFTVPYGDRQGGNIAPVGGASDPNQQEYYPAFSPDDAYLAFDRCPNDLNMYNQVSAEVSVIPSAGGTATRLNANDPPACSGAKSPGVTNSWPKWAPAVTTAPDGRSFYWLVFSSTRLGSLPQLFVTAVVTDARGVVSTYGALYLWNQPSAEGNHTPAWEYFNVPPATRIQ